MLNDISDQWNRFLEFEYAYEILMGVGAIILIIAVLKIIRSSLKMLFWVVLGSIGFLSFSYGFNNGDGTLPGGFGSDRPIDLADIVRDGKEDVLRVLCERMPDLQKGLQQDLQGLQPIDTQDLLIIEQ